MSEAKNLVKNYGNIEPISLDVADALALDQAVSNSDVVVRFVSSSSPWWSADSSLLPAPMHVNVAEHCIKHGKHLVTASYISPEMRALDEK